MQLEKCRILRLRAMLAIASFIAAFPTSHIISEEPTFSIPVSRSGEKRGVDCLNAKGNMSRYWARVVHGLAELHRSSRAKKPAWEWNGGLCCCPCPPGSL